MRRLRIVRLNDPVPLQDWVAARLRTAAPLFYGWFITWLASFAPFIAEQLSGPSMMAFVTSVVAALWYALWAQIQDRIPAWLRTVVLWHPATPDSYSPPVRDQLGNAA